MLMLLTHPDGLIDDASDRVLEPSTAVYDVEDGEFVAVRAPARFVDSSSNSRGAPPPSGIRASTPVLSGRRAAGPPAHRCVTPPAERPAHRASATQGFPPALCRASLARLPNPRSRRPCGRPARNARPGPILAGT